MHTVRKVWCTRPVDRLLPASQHKLPVPARHFEKLGLAPSLCDQAPHVTNSKFKFSITLKSMSGSVDKQWKPCTSGKIKRLGEWPPCTSSKIRRLGSTSGSPAPLLTPADCSEAREGWEQYE